MSFAVGRGDLAIEDDKPGDPAFVCGGGDGILD